MSQTAATDTLPSIPEPDASAVRSGPFDFADPASAVTIHCAYSQREEMTNRLFDEHGTHGEGLKLVCPSCGTSVCFGQSDRIPTATMYCGSGRHTLIRWISTDS